MNLHVVFYEKPGCISNARQKAELVRAGCRLEVRNILTWPFTGDELKSFFTQLPLEEWFNRSAPAIRDGFFDVASVNNTEAIDAMLADRLLIRRPLMQIGTLRIAGFSAGAIACTGIGNIPGPRFVMTGGADAETCPGDLTGIPCHDDGGNPDRYQLRERLLRSGLGY